MESRNKFIADIIIFLSNRLPCRIFIILGKTVSLFYYLLNIKNKSIVKENLKNIHIKFSIKLYLNFAQFLCENICLWNKDIDAEQFVWHNREVLDNAISSGRSVFIISVHYGNWQLAGQAIQKSGYNLSVVYEKKDEWIYDYLDKIRIKYGIKLIERSAGLKEILDDAAEKRIIGILIDQKSKNLSVKPVDFLKIRQDLPYGWFKLLKKKNFIPICLMTKYENHKHHIYFINGENLDYQGFYSLFERFIKKDMFQYDFYNRIWSDINC